MAIRVYSFDFDGYIASGLISLNKNGILTEENRGALVLIKKEYSSFASALNRLNRSKILTDENRRALLSEPSEAGSIADRLIEQEKTRNAVETVNLIDLFKTSVVEIQNPFPHMPAQTNTLG